MKQLIILWLIPYTIFSGPTTAGFENPAGFARNNYVSARMKIVEGQSLLKEGDLVVRLNRDPSSQFIKSFNRRDKRYSHSGIVLLENGYPFVYHIINGSENPDEKLRKDSLIQFCDPGRNRAYGIFRYEMTTEEISRLKEFVHKLYLNGIRFDNAFDFKTENRMYCSEMISKSLAVSTNNRINIKPTKLTPVEAIFLTAYSHLPFPYTCNLGVVSIDDLYFNSFCREIREYEY